MEAGETIGRYKILKHLASGGMAEVFLARLAGPAGFEKVFVIKQVIRTLAEREDVVRMFVDEARLAARLSHPNIGQIYELGESEDGYYLAMEYVSGENLASVRRAASRAAQSVPPFFIARVASQILEALAYAHQFKDPARGIDGIVHRDVTPHNILVSYDGHVKLVDFGIAKAAGRTATAVGRLKGKFGYLSPEALRQEPLDGRADLFSLGVAMYELIGGVHPFATDNPGDTLMRIAAGDYKPLDQVAPGCPLGIVATIHRALSARVEDRYASAQQMLEGLEGAIAAERLATSSAGMSEYMRVLFEGRIKQAQSQVVEGLEPTVEVALASLALAEEDAGDATVTAPSKVPSAPPRPPPAGPARQERVVTSPITESLIDIPPPRRVTLSDEEQTEAMESLSRYQALLRQVRIRLAALKEVGTRQLRRVWTRTPDYWPQMLLAFVVGSAAATLVNVAVFHRSPRPSSVGNQTLARTSPGTETPVDSDPPTTLTDSQPDVGGKEVALPDPGPKRGLLVVKTESHAAVFVDGHRVGTGAFHGPVSAGEHWVEARSSRERKKMRIEVAADATRVVSLPVRRR